MPAPPLDERLVLEGFREAFGDGADVAEGSALSHAVIAAARGAIGDRAFRASELGLGGALARAVTGDGDPVAALSRVEHADLGLAIACVEGNRDAQNAFAALLGRVPEYVRKVDSASSFGDEVRQDLARKLLGGPGEPGKLALYTGRGPLGGFLRVAAVRLALNLKRADRSTDVEAELEPIAEATNAEMAVLKAQHAPDVRRALENAVKTLDAPDRLALRLHYVDGLTIDDVARACRVSRATAARMLSRARWHVRGELHRELEALLRGSVGASTLDALIGDSLAESLARLVNEPGK